MKGHSYQTPIEPNGEKYFKYAINRTRFPSDKSAVSIDRFMHFNTIS